MTFTEAQNVYIVANADMYAAFGGAWVINPCKALAFESWDEANDHARYLRDSQSDPGIGVFTLADVLRG